MDNHSVFQVAAITQLLLINMLIPLYGARKSKGYAKVNKSNFGLANLLVICCGIVIVVLVYTPSLFEETQIQLAGLGALFAAQMMPLLLLKKRSNTNATTDDDRVTDSLSLKRIQRIVIAIFLSSCVTIAYFTALEGDVSWLKLGMLSSACGILYLLSRRALNADNSHSGNGGMKKASILLVMIAILSIYWTLKEVIFATNSHELRPIMMSIFMQVTALITLPSVITEALRVNGPVS